MADPYNLRRQQPTYLTYRYNITESDYDRMLLDQGGGCAICGKKPNHRRLHVDHDHACCPPKKSCGKCVRGLLCDYCNTRLRAMEDPVWFSAAQTYLAKDHGPS